VVADYAQSAWARAYVAAHPTCALIDVGDDVCGGLREQSSASRKRDRSKKDYFNFPDQGQGSFFSLPFRLPGPGSALAAHKIKPLFMMREAQSRVAAGKTRKEY
jgi:hypothetical protein